MGGCLEPPSWLVPRRASLHPWTKMCYQQHNCWPRFDPAVLLPRLSRRYIYGICPPGKTNEMISAREITVEWITWLKHDLKCSWTNWYHNIFWKLWAMSEMFIGTLTFLYCFYMWNFGENQFVSVIQFYYLLIVAASLLGQQFSEWDETSVCGRVINMSRCS